MTPGSTFTPATPGNALGSIDLKATGGQAATKGQLIGLDMDINTVATMLALMPAGLHGVVRTRLYDMLSHHRLSVGKYHKFPGGRQAQKWLFSRMYRYTNAPGVGATPLKMMGESFIANVDGWDPKLVEISETGGTRTVNDPMVVPMTAGKVGSAREKAIRDLREAIKAGRTTLVRTPRALLVIDYYAGRGSRNRGAKSTILGTVQRKHTLKPMLGFFRSAAAVTPRHFAHIERDLEIAQTEAGREALAQRGRLMSVTNRVKVDALREYLKSNPGQHAAAQRFAKRVAKSVRTEFSRQVREGGG